MKVDLITVVTNSFNSERWIGRLYQSLASQTDKNFEWIIVDDGSTDDTVTTIASLKFDNLFNVKFFKMPFNSGGGIATSVCMLKAQGDIIVRVDHDDELEPNAISVIRESFRLSQKDDKIAGILFPSIDTFGKKISSLSHLQLFKYSKFIHEEKQTTDGLLALKAKVAKHYYGLPERSKVGLSSTTLLGISKEYYFQFFDGSALLKYHRHNPNSVTSLKRISNKTVYSYARSLDFHDKHYYTSPIRWIRHTLTLFHYSLCVHHSIRPIFKYFNRPSTIMWCLILAPVGILTSKFKKIHNVVYYPEDSLEACLKSVSRIELSVEK